jgi:hypothetical protein
LGARCFIRAGILNLEFEADSKLKEIGECCLPFTSLGSVCLPRNVRVVRKSAFECSLVQFVTFDGESKLDWVEDKCFSGCENLVNVVIPEGAEVADARGEI